MPLSVEGVVARTICVVNAQYALDMKKVRGPYGRMSNKHPHASALDAIGEKPVCDHYNLSKRAWQKWRAQGVPKIHWNSLALLAQTKGKPAPNFGAGK